MESKEFFDGQTTARSVISLVVETCIEALCREYRAKPDGNFVQVNLESGKTSPVPHDEMFSNVCAWVRGLEGGTPLQNRIESMVRANPGWETIIALRVIRELRRRQL